jgi:hypothetical protein
MAGYRSKREKLTGRKETGRFLALPHAVIQSDAFESLSGNSIKLLVQIASQYKGRNNGQLTASFGVLKEKGWKSKTTLARCIQELIDAGFIVKTRQGSYPKTLSLYAITWQVLDDDLNGVYDGEISALVGRHLSVFKK